MNTFGRIWDAYQARRAIREALAHTLVSAERAQNLNRLVRAVDSDRIFGDVVECGVYNGGTAAVLARVATHSQFGRTVWLFDSFQGMPPTTLEDGAQATEYVGKVVGSVDRVRDLLRRTGANMNRVRIVEGLFSDTFPTVNVPAIALLNIDADWYESVKLCLDKFYDAVVARGFVSIDDYGHWPGCRKAVDEFFVQRALSYQLHKVDYTAHWFQKV